MSTVETSLTAPEDRKDPMVAPIYKNQPPLSEEEADSAVNDLNKNQFVQKYRNIERRYADPAIALQHIGLISFRPAKGATPNEHGVYGFIKSRGNYATEGEANTAAETLIREVDAYHEIFHIYVGRPFPATGTFDKFVKTVAEVDLRKQVKESVTSDIKKKKAIEKRAVLEIKEKEEELRRDVEEEPDPFDTYTTLRVKLAQVGFTYLETDKKKLDMREIILRTRGKIEDMDGENDQYKEKYMSKFMDARKAAGIEEASPNNFIQFLNSDMKEELGF
jgi:hypothetical protein